MGYSATTRTVAPHPFPGPEEIKIAEGYKLQPLTLFLLLGAFSNGCAALTGIEAISNGVPGVQETGGEERGYHTRVDGLTSDGDVPRHERPGLPLWRSSARE